MKVAQVVCTDAFAGVERYVTNLAISLSPRLCETTIIGGDGRRIQELIKPYPRIAWSPASSFWGAARLLHKTRAQFDLIHAHMTAAESAAVLGDPRGLTPLVSTRHFAALRGSTPAGRLAGHLISRRVRAQVSVSRHVAESIEGPSVVIHPGVPDPGATPDPATRDRVVLVANRLEPEKQTETALNIWHRSGLSEQGWTLWVAGIGRELRKLETLAESLGVASSCEFLGFVDDLGALQRRAAVFLSTAPNEHFGLAVVEAMANGLPVVASAAGGHLETVGLAARPFLFEPSDIAGGARHLLKLATDEAERASYGEALRRLCQESFTLDGQADRMIEFYRLVIE